MTRKKGKRQQAAAPAPAVRIAPLSALRDDPKNANKGTDRGRDATVESFRKFGAGRSIFADRNLQILGGHKSKRAAIAAGLKDALIVPSDGRRLIVVQRTDLDASRDPRAAELAVADNRTSELGLAWDAQVLAALKADGVDLTGLWTTDELARLIGDGTVAAAAGVSLSERFGVAPFSVLNAREGWWQDRKRAWIALGIQSEIGRGNVNLAQSHSDTTSTVDFYAQKRALEARLGRTLSKQEAADLMREAGTLKNDRAANAKRKRGGLTWKSDQVAEKGLNYYRKRQPNATPSGAAMPAANYRKNRARGDGRGRPIGGKR